MSSWQLRASAEIERRKRRRAVEFSAPTHWRDWLNVLFAPHVKGGYSPRHRELWQWVWSIEPEVKPRPFVAVWPREGGKSTSAELAAVALGARKVRHYVWYVRETQAQADGSVTNIMDLLESPGVEQYYPAMAEREIGKYGAPRAWRRQQLRTASEFVVDAIGLDTAVRGARVKERRPDFIVLDDIDGKHDTPKTTTKKVETITTSLLPAGSQDCAILAIQNLIIPDGVFARLANVGNSPADFLADRIISGPHPAVSDATIEQRSGKFVLISGNPTWRGQNLQVCQQNIDTWGITAWLQEAQHEVDDPPGGIWDHIEFQHIEWSQLPEFVQGAVWVDPAVTATDESDSYAIQADGLGIDNKLYRLYSWEAISSPEDAIRRATLKCLELGFTVVGVETDQGGDTWEVVFSRVWDKLVSEGETRPRPSFKQAKAGAGHGSKVARNQQMLVDYEHGKVYHAIGTHRALERALKRFPKKKPFDLVDVSYWSWWDLMGNRIEVANLGQALAQRRRR